jgi:hypothetical protein
MEPDDIDWEIDRPLVEGADRAASWIQATHGISLPVIQRESVVAVAVTFLGVVIAEGSLIGWDSPRLVFYGAAAPGLALFVVRKWRELDRDARAPWTEALSSKYLALAAAQRATAARAPWIWFVAAQQLAMAFLAAWGQLGPNTMAFAPFNLAVAARCYLACATPRDPGKRGRDRRLVPALG